MKSGLSTKTPLRSHTPLRVVRNRNVQCNTPFVKQKESVHVFCRVRPLQSEGDLSCIRIKDSKTLVLTPPEIAVNYKIGGHKETQYVFKRVFSPGVKQREIFSTVAQPLVEDLIRGKNGLLFTYGVTGSGKTFTMTGDIYDRGIMPRCFDILFKTLADYQTKKFVFKPDKLNGFEILSEADAMLLRQAEMHSRFVRPKRKDSDPEIASQASTEPKGLEGVVNEDNMYAVFVTYVEIYNNNVYDLLEDTGIQRSLQSKMIREDANHNMFVHGVTEIEIKTVEEAIEAFQFGQKRKRMGHTVLNAESSRSHSVFTIRVVQAPTNSLGEEVVQDRQVITVSQLSLVDLAGSERTSRTKNTGQRLREAGNINNSLMNLRTCLEYLRENQTTGTNKKIPYRDSRLTHLFKNYFDGDGQVSMVVCVNPRAEDYDENLQVLKFAEMTQEVQVSMSTPIQPDLGLNPGRRKANKIFKAAIRNLAENGYPNTDKIEIDLGLVYSLGGEFPKLIMNSSDSDKVIHDLTLFLEQRIAKRKMLLKDAEARWDNLRLKLMDIEKDNISLKAENESLKAVINQERQKHIALENKIIVNESSLDELNRKMKERDELIKELQKQLNEKKFELNQKEKEKVNQKRKFTTKMAVEADKMNRELEQKLREQRNKLKESMRIKEEKLKLVKNIIDSEDIDKITTPVKSLSSESLVVDKKKLADKQIHDAGTTKTSTYYTPQTHTTRPGIPVANPRHRRSRSAGEKWLEHRAPNPVPVGTILQPYLKNRKSVTKLTNAKEITKNDVSNYCLITQEADSDGGVETMLYKGGIIPTSGGGAQVIFNDVECLKQRSPVTSPIRKRPSDGSAALSQPSNFKDVASKCSIGIEGHSSKKFKI